MRIFELGLAFLLVLVSSAVLLPPGVHAAGPVPVFDARVQSDNIRVSLNLHVSQNLTGLQSDFSFPAVNATLAGDNLTTVSSYLQAAIRDKAPEATVSDLSLQLATTPVESVTQHQWFNVSLQFQLSGVETLENGIAHVDMTWKSFNVPENVTVGQVEVNNIGLVYLYSAATAIARTERSITTNVITYGNIVNFFRVTTGNLPPTTAKINLLNFTQLFPSVDTWHQSYDYSTGSVTWSFKLNKILGVMITTTSNEPQATPTTNGAIYTIEAAVSAPARSWAQGNSINAVFNDNPETLMASTIVAGMAILVTSLIIERRVLKTSVRRKSKR